MHLPRVAGSSLLLPFGRLIFAAILVVGPIGSWTVTAADPTAWSPVDFDRQIRPILSENCFACHGPDDKQRKAKLRLDTYDGAVKDSAVIVAGQAEKSELIDRIASGDPKKRMPPPKTGKRLTAAQVDLLRQWINQGAKWSRHWAFVKPERPPLPRVREQHWLRNPIDAFIVDRLEREGLQPLPEADKVTLIRRLTLDLTGLPPTPTEVDAFLADGRADAYEQLVERLLASPRYGERMAVDWLDAARFADTHGYHIDSGRDMTRWREWVIAAFNRNLPFDRFTIEQLAGDLLPQATLEQRIASGFNRNHMINFEGGAIPEEYHNAYLVDRVNTMGTVWLGLGIGCCQCHDHKFDPFTQKEYYQLYAFFNNVPENGLDGSKGNAMPFIKVPLPEQQKQLDRLATQIKELEQRLARKSPELTAGQLKQGKSQLADLHQARAALDKQVPTTMVMQEMPKPRDTYLLVRGQYDRHGAKVTTGVPAALPPLPQGAPANRFGLAEWLVDPSQPLTARVIINRYWQMYFGTGIVKTSEDFGVQGEYPSHPELLDWLATELIRSGWDVKAMQRLIVTSAAYRQSSVESPALVHKDPENRLLGHGPRLRLQAEFIRDQALTISGLLNGEIGGASVSPYQPPGLWEELASRLDGANWTAQVYRQSHGKDLYRRTMYTFWKRTSPPPTLVTFDAPDRETCTVRRARTNTPLQALVLMNDPTYVEASRKLAERLMTEASSSEDRIVLAFRLATARKPSTGEVAVLRKIFDNQLAFYHKDGSAALKLLGVGEAKRNQRLNPAELAAWATVASVILNLDETVTKG
jgi:mono/diheme cytochrome c family protein